MLSVREIQLQDISILTDYWLSASPEFMKGMGVDMTKMPSRDQWYEMLTEQINTAIPEKKSYAMIWLLDGVQVGHSNISKIIYGEEAYMHLHLWKNDSRQKGLGVEFVKLTIPHYFEKFKLKTLYCEPYALNHAPNKTMEKLGFEFVKEYITVPGWINFEQPVKLWKMEKSK